MISDRFQSKGLLAASSLSSYYSGERRGFFSCLCGLSLLIALSVPALCQRRPSEGGPIGKMEFRSRHFRGQDSEALALLRRKLRPSADFSGEQVTEFAGGRLSRQRVIGDTRGRVRVDYLSPESMAGDVLLLAPDSFRNYRKSQNTLEVALWPTRWNEREKRILDGVRKGHMSVVRVGEEQIAGRNAAILVLTANRPLDGPLRGQIKYWIDIETGIQLKIEVTGPRGMVSRTTITSLTVGPAANVTAQDFKPSFMSTARISPLFPPARPPYRTVAETAGKLPFTPVEPTALPGGYHLSGVWVFAAMGEHTEHQRPAALLRYSDGVTNFSLYQRPDFAAKPDTPETFRRIERRHIQKWHIASGSGVLEIVYIGYLPTEQVQALRDSLR